MNSRVRINKSTSAWGGVWVGGELVIPVPYTENSSSRDLASFGQCKDTQQRSRHVRCVMSP